MEEGTRLLSYLVTSEITPFLPLKFLHGPALLGGYPGIFFKILFLERGKEGEREEEKH